MTKRKENPQPGGQPTKYKSEYCELILEMVNRPRPLNIYEMASEIGVSYESFMEWRRVHPAFSLAYAQMKTTRTGQHLRTAEDNIENGKANHKCIAMLLTNECHVPAERNVLAGILSGKTLKDKSDSVLKAADEGRITSEEMSKALSSVSLASRIEETSELRPKLEEIERLLEGKK